MTIQHSSPRRKWRTLIRAACLLALAAALGLAGGPFGATTARANSPVLTLTPDSDPCDSQTRLATLRGGNFPPGLTIPLYAVRTAPFRGDNIYTLPSATVAADGTFTVEFELRQLGCGYGTQQPAGTRYEISAGINQVAVATTTFTVTAAATEPEGQLTLSVDCATTPEATTIGNQTDRPLDLSSWSLGSLSEPRAGEPFSLDIHAGRSETLPVGAFYRYETGANARANVLTSEEIYDDYAPSEGARLTTPFGLFTVRCDEQSRTFSLGSRCFVETGQCVRGRFLEYWQSHGLDLGAAGVSSRESLALFGYPISDEFAQTLEDGNTYIVQYFERARLEAHPENAAPYDVLLGQFGRRLHPADPPVPAEAGSTYFSETGHNVGPRFGAYWRANGGLAQFGYPLTEPFEQRLEDGQVYTVQYFERVRLELHPEHAAPYQVELGQFGRLILGPTGGPGLPR